MIRQLSRSIREYKMASLATPLLVSGEVVMECLIPFLIAELVNEVKSGCDMNRMLRYGLLLVLMAALSLAFGALAGCTCARASCGLARNLRKDLFYSIQDYSFENIDHFTTSSLVTRMTTDVTNVQNAYMMILRMAMRAPASMIVAMIMSFIISPRLASVYLVAVILLGILMFFIMNSATKYFKQVFERYDDLNESVQENVSAIRVVKAYVREDYENDKFKKAAYNIYKMFVHAENNLVAISPAMTTVVYICILLISWLGAHMIIGSTLTTGELMSLLTYCMNILMSLMMLSMIFVMITMSEASGKRIAEVIEEKSTLVNPENPVMSVPDGSIRFEHVDFAYNAESKEPVLKDINLDIHSGESIGIIGGTGSA